MRSALIALALLVSAAAAAQQPRDSDASDFGDPIFPGPPLPAIGTGLEAGERLTIPVQVEEVSRHAVAAGASRTAIQGWVRDLLSSRGYTYLDASPPSTAWIEGPGFYLYVQLTASSRGFSASFEVKRYVEYYVEGVPFGTLGSTWSDGSAGVYAGVADLKDAIEGHVVTFLDQHRLVNR